MSENWSVRDQLTKGFFEQEPYAALLRNVCLRALGAADDLLVSSGTDSVAFGSLFESNRQLSELGIESNMHAIQPSDPDADAKRQRMVGDPVMAMQYIAGQARNAMVRSGGFSSSGSPEAIAEYDELNGAGGQISVMDLEHIGPKTTQFVRDVTAIGAIRGFVDYEAGPSEL